MRVSPRLSWASKPATEHGAALTFTVPNPDSRSGQSPHLQGRVMDEQRTIFIGIDVSKDRLDVHLRLNRPGISGNCNQTVGMAW